METHLVEVHVDPLELEVRRSLVPESEDTRYKSLPAHQCPTARRTVQCCRCLERDKLVSGPFRAMSRLKESVPCSSETVWRRKNSQPFHPGSRASAAQLTSQNFCPLQPERARTRKSSQQLCTQSVFLMLAPTPVNGSDPSAAFDHTCWWKHVQISGLHAQSERRGRREEGEVRTKEGLAFGYRTRGKTR